MVKQFNVLRLCIPLWFINYLYNYEKFKLWNVQMSVMVFSTLQTSLGPLLDGEAKTKHLKFQGVFVSLIGLIFPSESS